jgi:hypothetical protein
MGHAPGQGSVGDNSTTEFQGVPIEKQERVIFPFVEG